MTPILKTLIWLDVQVLRIVTLGKSRPGETISSASWSLYRDNKWQGRLLVPVIDFFFSRWEPFHCRKSWLGQKHLYD